MSDGAGNKIVWGATVAEWDACAQLNLIDLLPSVCDPSIPPMRGDGKGARAGTKTPSYVTGSNKCAGFKKWPDHQTASIDNWKGDDRLGICMITRTIHAMDVDVEDPKLAAKIEEYIRLEFPNGFMLPKRGRENSPKFALLYRLIDSPGLKKTVLPVSATHNHFIEFLHERQQTMLCGRHPKGDRYYWPEGIPTMEDVPAIEYNDFLEFYRKLRMEFMPDAMYAEEIETGNEIFYRLSGQRNKAQIDYDADPIFRKLVEKGLVRSIAADGKVNIFCPWGEEHTSDSGETEAVYFPKGLGNFHEHAGFKCLHAHCADKNHLSLLSFIGIDDEFFPIVEGEPSQAALTRPKFETKKQAKKQFPATLNNVVAALGWPERTEMDLYYDSFTDQIVVTDTRNGYQGPIDDDIHTELRLRLGEVGLEGGGPKEMVRDAVSLVAKRKKKDSAILWLKDLKWDGVHRLPSFHTTVLKLEDTEYHRAVMNYMWTALAGRILTPGCKADMVPILIGKQGLRKSTFVEALSPGKDQFTRIDLTQRDADLARQLRGKVVAEWEELRGITSRDAPSIKGWVSRDKDDWIPKFKEYGTSNPRRFLVLGTTNERRFHNDPTGGRRWLPLLLSQIINTEYLEENNEQLWAEARELFLANNSKIMYYEAERLANETLKMTSVRDAWVDPVVLFINEHQGAGGWTSSQIMQVACSIPTAQLNHFGQERVRRVMTYLGWEEDNDGRWWSAFA